MEFRMYVLEGLLNLIVLSEWRNTQLKLNIIFIENFFHLINTEKEETTQKMLFNGKHYEF